MKKRNRLLEFTFAETRTGCMVHIFSNSYLNPSSLCNSKMKLDLLNSFKSLEVPKMLCNSCAKIAGIKK